MLIKLCYKEYPFKISQSACKRFFDQTGLDLQTVFMKYISACVDNAGLDVTKRLIHFSELYSRDVACKAMHCMIKEEDKSIPLAEIEDGTFRVSWVESKRDDDISEPWPLVMLDVALQINTYFTENLNIKKSDTSEG